MKRETEHKIKITLVGGFGVLMALVAVNGSHTSSAVEFDYIASTHTTTQECINVELARPRQADNPLLNRSKAAFIAYHCTKNFR